MLLNEPDDDLNHKEHGHAEGLDGVQTDQNEVEQDTSQGVQRYLVHDPKEQNEVHGADENCAEDHH